MLEQNPWNPGGIAGCILALFGWSLVAVWSNVDASRELLWWALGTFSLGTLVSSLGWYFGYGFVNRTLPMVGMVLNVGGIAVVIVLLYFSSTEETEPSERLRSARRRRRVAARARGRTKRKRRRTW